MHFNCPELLFLFLKGMADALAPCSYLVGLDLARLPPISVIDQHFVVVVVILSSSVTFSGLD
jgi:hypothetical protein